VIEMLPDLPDNVVGFRAVGEVKSDDYEETLLPAVDAAIAKSGKIRFLYVLDSEFSGYSAGAMWQDTKLGFEHLKAFEKIAVVTDTSWVADGVKAFGWMIPGDVKVYANDQLDEATVWVSS
jgi:hypothetical protein